MKKIYSYIAILLFTISFSQIPQGYYDNATGTGYTLKTQLFNIINQHNVVSYSPGLWNLYTTTDARADGKVWDIYTTCNFTFGTGTGGNQDQGSGGTAECQFFNKEHTFPKSWFGGVSGTPMYSDAFHVMPTDKKVNGNRGNLAYGIVGTASFTSSNGCKIGNNIAPSGPAMTVFEPADEYKGDIARNYFYMATCYEDLIAGWENYNSNGAAFLDGTNTRVYEQWALSMLYSWHLADPVSTKEINRNNAVYAVQANRNPFIDHPEWVNVIWGTSLSTSIATFSAGIAVYPNPTNNHTISIGSATPIDDIQLITINGQIIQEIKKPVFNNATYTLENLPQGFYFLKLTSNDNSITKKISVN